MATPKSASWVVRKILESRSLIMEHQQLQGNIHNRLQIMCTDTKFQIKQMYLKLIPVYARAEWKSLMLHTNTHPRYRFILCLAEQQRLATMERLLKIGIQIPAACAFCGHSLEYFSHLFFECTITKKLWSRLCSWLGYNRSIGDWKTELEWACKKAKSRRERNAITSCVFAMTVALIWRERNIIRFEQAKFDDLQICREIELHIHIRGKNIVKWKEALYQLNWIP
ncbi:PREDICTED: uncharacterized protein LOC109236708 [Nicotiana attenuata]|uniref:uncharacterized protein LOC109236708 n=1 Tax=Nicotiana attenuata TaxID=49451 RepID=UPI000905CCB7|nr:PREDICTED: uncharacterized protein LOC109236708 [Nicotiana attenuata]